MQLRDSVPIIGGSFKAKSRQRFCCTSERFCLLRFDLKSSTLYTIEGCSRRILKFIAMLHPSFAICSNRVVTPEGVRPAAILVDGEKVEGIVSKNLVPSQYLVEDVGDLVAMAGLVDTHVHINEPGRADWEGFETATKAAAAGGITTLVDMPLNSSPVTTTVEAFQQKITSANGKLFVDCGFHAGLIPGNAGELPNLIDAGVLGVKAFLIDSGLEDFPRVTHRDLRRAMPVIARREIPLLVHAELARREPLVRLDSALRKARSSSTREYRTYLSSRPRKWEERAIALMIRLCGHYRCRVHIVHLSNADAVPAVARARSEGLPITVETCPHYLCFSAGEIADGDTRFKCAPPIREEENRGRLWAALQDGVIDFIVSDHSPCPPSMKHLEEGAFGKAWGGISSLQLGLSIVWSEARKRGFSVEHVAEWMCRKPAELVGLHERKGSIAVGMDADLVVWNPDEKFTVTEEMLYHRHKMTPYEGRELSGTVEMTFLRGNRIYRKGSPAGQPKGTVLLREPSTTQHHREGSEAVATE